MKSEVRTLTGLRGVAASWVALYHIHWQAVSGGAAWPLLRHGYLAVDIFFVLSGYVMMMTYARPGQGRWTIGLYGSFIVRRIGRVWPAYALVTIALGALMAAHILKNPPPALPRALINLTLTESWWHVPPIDEPAWSVSTELAAYIAFPLLTFIAAFRPVAARIVLLALLLFSVSWLPDLQRTLAGHDPGGNGPLDISSSETLTPLIRCMIEFGAGMLTFSLANQRLIAAARSDWVAAAVMLVTLVLLCIPGTDFVIVFAIPALVVVTAASGRLSRHVFDNAVTYRLGVWSYALYLIHFHSNAIQIGLARHLARLGWPDIAASYLVQYLALIIASALLYKTIERPAQRLFRKLADRLERRSGARHLPPEMAKGAV